MVIEFIEFIACIVIAFSGTFLIDIISNHKDKILPLLDNLNYKKKKRINNYRVKCLKAALEFKDIIDKNGGLTRQQRTHFLNKITEVITKINDYKGTTDIDFKRLLETLLYDYKSITNKSFTISASTKGTWVISSGDNRFKSNQ